MRSIPAPGGPPGPNMVVHRQDTRQLCGAKPKGSKPFQRGDRLYTSESDVCRRQILMYKDGSRTEERHL